MNGTEVPLMSRPVGATTRAWIDRLAETECPAITARRSRRKAGAGGRDPIVWREARGANVVDVEGNRYVDLSGGFGVAAVGHRHPKVVEAIQRQAGELIHAMGDLFPSIQKIQLGEKLAELTPGDLCHSILGANGSDAVEAAIKTACVATGKSRVLAFEGSYHGMSLGALGVSGYRDGFRAPFAPRSSAIELRLPFPRRDGLLGPGAAADPSLTLDFVDRILGSDVAGSEGVAAVLVEPIQGRGGVIVPPAGWLRGLSEILSRHGVLLIADEIYTGFGRTGSRFVCGAEGVVPDLLCVGKAMGGGVPISACIGRGEVMERWGETQGEALHTSTFLGNPLTCAAALATLDVIESEGLVEQSRSRGAWFEGILRDAVGGHERVREIRGTGMMLGVELRQDDGPWTGGGVDAMNGLLDRGFIVTPSGPVGDVIGLSPPFVTTQEQLSAFVDALSEWLGQQ
jgi:4-aminobutyrate aminotransferase/(S)-3-amino-2-methylpropionate transaminase